MKIEVNRTTYTDISTIGEMFIDGKFQCFTLEDTVRQPNVKMNGKTAIPSGAYSVLMTFSPRFQEVMPLINNVPNFEGVRIHKGNDANDTEGCLLVGDIKGVNFIGDSAKAFEALYPLLAKAAEDNDPIVIVINDTYASAPTAEAPAKSDPAKATRKPAKGDPE